MSKILTGYEVFEEIRSRSNGDFDLSDREAEKVFYSYVKQEQERELRDSFAMSVMVGFAKNYRSATGYTKGGNVDKGMMLDAQLAYGFADAMMEARKEQ